MSWTKRQYIAQAFAEIGLAGYIFDITPEELETALIQLDSMVAGWGGRGIRLGWPLNVNPQDADLDQETGVTDMANEAIYCGLAVRMGPSYGKTVSAETRFFAKQGYDLLLSLAAMPQEKQFPRTLPAGAGNKTWRINNNPFVRPRPDNVLPDPTPNIEFD